MLTTFDRYLLWRYLHVVMVLMVSTIGLFAVVDGFTNLDEFQKNEGTLEMFLRMAQYYGFRSAMIIDLAGPTVLVISVVCTLGIFLKQGEFHPVLAAGIPTYRATLPLAIAMLTLNGLLAANQELLLPRLAPYLLGHHGELEADAQEVESKYDPKSLIYISGKTVLLSSRELTLPEFLLPTPTIATDLVTLRGEKATYVPPKGGIPAGWLIRNVSPPIEEMPLTDVGRRIIQPLKNGTDVFVLTALTADQLTREAANLQLVSTPTILRRLGQPSDTARSRRTLLVGLHSRLTRPLLTLIGLYVTIPLIIRRERMSVMQQVTNIAVCGCVLGIVYGSAMGMQYVGQAGFIQPDQAVWAPLIAGSGLAGWLSGIVRT